MVHKFRQVRSRKHCRVDSLNFFSFYAQSCELAEAASKFSRQRKSSRFVYIVAYIFMSTSINLISLYIFVVYVALNLYTFNSHLYFYLLFYTQICIKRQIPHHPKALQVRRHARSITNCLLGNKTSGSSEFI